METNYLLSLSAGDIFVQKQWNDEFAPTLIFLHDSLGCVTLWRDFPYQVAAGVNANLVMYDRVGYGESSAFKQPIRTIDYLKIEAAVLNEFIEKEGFKNVYLFGHSDGGSIALLAAAHYPEVIKGIITVGAHIFVEPETLDGVRIAKKMFEEGNLRSKLLKYHGDKTDAIVSAWVDTWLRDDFQDMNMWEDLKQIQCPTAVIQGDLDEYGTFAQVDGIVETVPHGKAKAYKMSGVGHTPYKEAKEETLQLTIQILKEFIQ